MIIQTGDKYNEELDKIISEIEAFRVKIEKWIEEKKFKVVDSILAEAYKLSIIATIDEIKALISKYENSNV